KRPEHRGDEQERGGEKDRLHAVRRHSVRRFGILQSQRLLRKKTIRATAHAIITPATVQNANAGPKPGNLRFIPKIPGIRVSGRRMTLTTVRMRSTLFWRCAITDSFVPSRPSTTSL